MRRVKQLFSATVCFYYIGIYLIGYLVGYVLPRLHRLQMLTVLLGSLLSLHREKSPPEKKRLR